MKHEYITILNKVCKEYHKSRTEALELLIKEESIIRTKELHKDPNTNIRNTYFYQALGHVSDYYNKKNNQLQYINEDM